MEQAPQLEARAVANIVRVESWAAQAEYWERSWRTGRFTSLDGTVGSPPSFEWDRGYWFADLEAAAPALAVLSLAGTEFESLRDTFTLHRSTPDVVVLTDYPLEL
jgi:hypothetical protein